MGGNASTPACEASHVADLWPAGLEANFTLKPHEKKNTTTLSH